MNVVAEVPVQGDDISLQHGLEVTIQKLKPLLTSDYVFLHTVLGLSNDFCHGECLCTHCHISKRQLVTPWHLLKTKPSVRTPASMTACLDAVRAGKPACETKGVVDYPILNFDPCDVVPAFLHIITGVFNKIFDYSKEKLVKLDTCQGKYPNWTKNSSKKLEN